MKTKSKYESPETEIVSLRVFTPILQNDEPIHEGGVSREGVFDAKQQTEYEEEEALPVNKNIWEDDEE
jgi:hypothetical protein